MNTFSRKTVLSWGLMSLFLLGMICTPTGLLSMGEVHATHIASK